MKLEAFDSSYFHGKFLFGDDGFQNMFVYRPKLDMLNFKKDKSTGYILSWKSKGVFTSKFKPLYTVFYIAQNFLDIKWEEDLIKIY